MSAHGHHAIGPGEPQDARGIIEDYLHIWSRRRHLHRAVLRTGSTDARAILAAKAFGGYPDMEALLGALVEPARIPPLSAAIAHAAPDAVLTLARVVALQNVLETDHALALLLYRLVAGIHGDAALAARHRKLAIDLALLSGEYDLARRWLEDSGLSGLEDACVRADLLNPFVQQRDDVGAWLEAVNWQLDADGVARLELLDSTDGPEAFDRLVARAPAQVADGPLVTVVITSWCPGTEFGSAFRSITAQTWRNLEILVIDDCSPDAHQPYLQSVVGEDPRARLIRMPRNGGTYVARNRGLAEAKGELFTVHDSDDWAHPERIERQVAAMLDDPRLVSTSSRALRLDGNLVFCLPGVSASRENASSLMFRRSAALDAIGWYDASRKGADTEYAVRLLRHFGPASHATLDAHLACIRLRTGSLSREEFKPGWRHPARAAYRRGYLWWHGRAAQCGSPMRGSGKTWARAFPQPIAFMPERESAEARARRRWAVVYLFDARDSAARPAGCLDELLALADAGIRVAVMHVESMLHPFVQEFECFSDELQELLAHGRIGEVLPTDDLEIGTLVVRDPSCLQFSDPHPFPFRARRVLVVPDAMPVGRPRGFAAADVDARIRDKLGIDPVWLLPAGAALEPWPGMRAEPRAWNGELVGPHLHRAPRTGPIGPDDTLRLACITDHATPALCAAWKKLAGTVDTRAWVVTPGGGPVAGAGRARVRTGRLPDDLDLAVVDLVLLQGDPRSPAMRSAALLAAASGCIVLGDPRWAAELGDPAMLAPDAPDADWLNGLAGDAAAVAANRQLSTRWLDSAGGAAALVRQLGGKPSA